MQLNTILQRGVERLASRSDTPKLDAEVLLAAVLRVSRSYLIAHDRDTLDAKHIKAFDALLIQRQAGVPIAYLTGTQEFWSQPYRVTPATLIPRPDTECLLAWVFAQYAADADCHVCDLGTGSGCIAITCALGRPGWQVDAVDQSSDALAIAQENADTLLPATRDPIRFYQSDWFAAIPDEQRYDIIISNPPYVASDDAHLGALQHEPMTALVSGSDGLDDIRRITADAKAYLDGVLVIEHGALQGASVREIFLGAGYSRVETHPDLSGQDRFTTGYNG